MQWLVDYMILISLVAWMISILTERVLLNSHRQPLVASISNTVPILGAIGRLFNEELEMHFISPAASFNCTWTVDQMRSSVLVEIIWGSWMCSFVTLSPLNLIRWSSLFHWLKKKMKINKIKIKNFTKGQTKKKKHQSTHFVLNKFNLGCYLTENVKKCGREKNLTQKV